MFPNMYQYVFPKWILIVLIYQIWETSRNKLKKAFCHQKLFRPFTIWINCWSDLKIFANSQPSASNFKQFSRSLEQFFLTVGQNNFRNKIPFISFFYFIFLQKCFEMRTLWCDMHRIWCLCCAYSWGQTSKSHQIAYKVVWPQLWSFEDVIQQGLDFSKKISKRKMIFLIWLSHMFTRTFKNWAPC